MSSIFSTQNRHTFLRRKNCFFWVATALSPPVGRCPALPGLPLNSGIGFLLRQARHGYRFRRVLGRRRRSGGGGGRDRGTRRNHAPGCPLIAHFLALLETLERFVDAHGQELQEDVRNSQAALELRYRF